MNAILNQCVREDVEIDDLTGKKKKPTTQASFSRRSNLATAPTKRERKELRHGLISDNNWSPKINAALSERKFGSGSKRSNVRCIWTTSPHKSLCEPFLTTFPSGPCETLLGLRPRPRPHLMSKSDSALDNLISIAFGCDVRTKLMAICNSDRTRRRRLS